MVIRNPVVCCSYYAEEEQSCDQIPAQARARVVLTLLLTCVHRLATSAKNNTPQKTRTKHETGCFRSLTCTTHVSTSLLSSQRDRPFLSA